ncbi:MAG: hypothetical protein ACP5H2_03595 [Solirubrobacteraceae bacterium]
MTHVLEELSARLGRAAAELRSGHAHPERTLEIMEDCATLASEAAAQVESHVRAQLEPLPDLPGQLPLSASR